MQLGSKKWKLGCEIRQLGNNAIDLRLPEPYSFAMKININTDINNTETEITIVCSRISDDVEKLIAALRMLDMKLTGRKDGRHYIIEAADVMYIESTDKRTFLYTTERDSGTNVYESSFRLYELEVKLADGDFLRASKNCLFNINHVLSIAPDLDRRLILTMDGGYKLVVSRQYATAVKNKLEAYNG